MTAPLGSAFGGYLVSVLITSTHIGLMIRSLASCSLQGTRRLAWPCGLALAVYRLWCKSMFRLEDVF